MCKMRTAKGKIIRFSAIFVALCMVLTALPLVNADTAIDFLYCDADCDGELTASDARTVLRYSVDLDAYSEGHLRICGAKEKFSSEHARYILRLCVGLEKNGYQYGECARFRLFTVC